MHPLVKGAIGCGVLSLVGLLAPRGTAPKTTGPAASASGPPALVKMPCPPRHLPEGDVCVPLLDADEPLVREEGVQRDRRARGRSFDVLVRRPDRPEDPKVFSYPVDGDPLLLRGFDDSATRTDDESPVAIALSAERGAPVRALTLLGQTAKARVVAVGRLVGNTVVTAHDVAEADRTRTYLLVHGHLDAAGPDIKPGAELDAGATLGFVGDSGSPGLVRLHLEARRVREETILEGLSIAKLVDPSVSVPTDLRNVLPPK